MLKMYISPGRYVQGPGAIKEIGKYVGLLGGKNPLVVGDPIGLREVRESMDKSFSESGLAPKIVPFEKECSRAEIFRIQAIGAESGMDVVVAVGGGKAIDVAKAVTHETRLPLAVVPTIAATDAPCSALSVIYTPEGVFESFLVLHKNPDLVLVDTEVIARAPVRLFVSGMADGLSTWIEAETSYRTGTPGMQGTVATLAAMSLAKLCYETILENGYQARLAVEQGVATEAVERIVEANTLLSGIGFESGGLAAAHSFQDGITVLEESHGYFHGEKVSFGIIFQLVLENRPREQIKEVLKFCLSVGLPVTLEEIGVKEATQEKLWKVAEATCGPGETIHSEPFPVTVDRVYSALVAADALGQAAKLAWEKQGELRL